MGFIDRILADDDTKLDPHLLGAAFWSLHRGKITRAQTIARLGLLSADEAELDLVIAEHDSLSTQQQPLYALDVTQLPILVEGGEITTNAQAKAYLNI